MIFKKTIRAKTDVCIKSSKNKHYLKSFQIQSLISPNTRKYGSVKSPYLEIFCAEGVLLGRKFDNKLKCNNSWKLKEFSLD